MDSVVAAATAGDEGAFSQLVQRYRAELRVHCYRMVGSYTESEDLVQETLLRAWRRRETYAGRASFRAWLYRIATNACLDAIEKRPRDPLSLPGSPPPAVVDGLEPCPDALLDLVATADAGPESAVVAAETIELAFLAAMRQLPARQRAVLILRDVLGWPAAEVASLLETSVASVNSALQRARPALRDRLPGARTDWTLDATEEESRVVRTYMDAIRDADQATLAALLAEDVRCSQQPWAGGNMTDEPVWYQGKQTMLVAWSPLWAGADRVESRMLPTRANRQPAFGMYVRAPGADAYEGFALTVLRLENGLVSEISSFHADLLPAFGLPSRLA